MPRLFLPILLLAACILTALPAFAEDVTIPEGFTPPAEVLLGVPYIKQNNKYSCSTDSLGMVMAYFDKDMDLAKYSSDDIWERSGNSVNTVRKKGNSMSALEKAAESFGFENMDYMKTDVETIVYLVTNEVPVVVNVRARGKKGEYSHCVVIDGFKADQLHIVDPVKGGFWEPRSIFEGRWWANLSKPKGKKSKTAFVLMPRNKNLFD